MKSHLLARSQELSEWLDRTINGLEIKYEDRARLAAACLDIALEHHRALGVLIAHSLNGSAFALVRLLFESYVRGVWIHRCASPEDLAALQADQLDCKFYELVDAIERTPAYSEERVLSEVKRNSWGAMNSFTHSGFLQIVRRLTVDAVTPNYSDAEIAEALTFANTIALLTAVAITAVAERDDISQTVLNKAKDVWTDPTVRA